MHFFISGQLFNPETNCCPCIYHGNGGERTKKKFEQLYNRFFPQTENYFESNESSEYEIIEDNMIVIDFMTKEQCERLMELADINGNLIEEKEVKPQKIKDPADTFSDIKIAADILLTERRVPLSRLFGVGFSVAGYLDKKRETLERAPYIGWPSFDLKNKLQNMFGKIVTVENVTRCVALAESKFGALKGIKDLVLIRSALGLGGAIITGGQLLNGNQNFAGDLGHILAVPEGKICSCGNCGCLNTVASGWAIMNKLGTTDKSYETANQFLTQNIQLRNLLNSESSDKVEVNAAAIEAGEALAKHLFTTLQILNPKVVCLTGPLGRHKKYSEAFRNTIISMGFDQKIILASERDIITPAMASVYLALSELVYSPSFNFEQILSSNQKKVVSK